MITFNSEEAKEWPTRRWQIIRQVIGTVLWKGPLLGFAFSVLVLTGAAGLCHLFEGQTLDFGLFQIPGQAGAPIFPVLRHFWVFTVWTIPLATAFLGLVGTAAVVTAELAYRRGN